MRKKYQFFQGSVRVRDTDFNSILNGWEQLIKNDKFRTEINTEFARLCEPYVPMQDGALAQNVLITPRYVRWTQPYAHYQYVGEVFGPNIPIKDADGNIVGWFSIPGQKKQPTGRAIEYSREQHPKATKEWDKAMLAERGEEFAEYIKQAILTRSMSKRRRKK